MTDFDDYFLPFIPIISHETSITILLIFHPDSLSNIYRLLTTLQKRHNIEEIFRWQISFTLIDYVAKKSQKATPWTLLMLLYLTLKLVLADLFWQLPILRKFETIWRFHEKSNFFHMSFDFKDFVAWLMQTLLFGVLIWNVHWNLGTWQAQKDSEFYDSKSFQKSKKLPLINSFAF